MQRLAFAMLRRRPYDAPLAALREYAARYPGLPVWDAMLAQAEHGLRSPAARRSVERCARDGFAAVLRTPDWLCALALLAEPVAAAGVPEQIARLTDALAPHADRNAVMDDAWAPFGPVARPLGALAVAAGRPEEAAERFARAAELAARWEAPGWELASLSDWLRSGAPAGAEQRGRALALARDLELPWIAAEVGQTTTP